MRSDSAEFSAGVRATGAATDVVSFDSRVVSAEGVLAVIARSNRHGIATSGGVINFTSTSVHNSATSAGWRHTRVTHQTVMARTVATNALVNPSVNRSVMTAPFVFLFLSVEQSTDFASF